MKTAQKKCMAVCLFLFVLPSVLLSADNSSDAANFLEIKKSAEQGNAKAQYLLGVLYDTGDGVPQNNGKAFEWFAKSAEQGNAEAQFFLAGMYHKGDRIPQDYTKAIELAPDSAETY